MTTTPTPTTTPTTPRATPRPAAASNLPAFQYVGASGLTVQGPVTRRLYRFSAPGAVLTVDVRDAPSLARVPQLRRA
jgi:hypothetical protein